MLVGQLCILWVHDAFDDELASPVRLDPIHVLPRQRSVKLAGGEVREREHRVRSRIATNNVPEVPSFGGKLSETPCRLAENIEHGMRLQLQREGQAVPDVLVPLPEHLQIGSEDERRAPGVLGSAHEVSHESLVSHHVELEPEWFGRPRRYVFDRVDRHGGKGERDPELLASSRCMRLTIRPHHPTKTTG
eukprot:768802-Hanusia_phi.AAC.3